MNARAFLYNNLKSESEDYFGLTDEKWLSHVCDAWMNDESNSAHRYDAMVSIIGDKKLKKSRILDMSSGCGTFVFYGLINGYDVYGVEPEQWKHQFNLMKARQKGYPPSYTRKYCYGVGENLPFADLSFDVISTYQTLEHVQNVKEVLSEMVRCLKWDGVIFLRAPDYFSTFEGHYRLPWLPLFPRKLAKLYLKSLGRPTVGLDTIQYVTNRNVKRILSNYPVVIIDKRRASLKKLAKTILNKAFRSENIIDLLIFKGINA